MRMDRGQARAAASGAGATKATRAGWLKEREQQAAPNVKKEYLETVKKVSPIRFRSERELANAHVSRLHNSRHTLTCQLARHPLLLRHLLLLLVYALRVYTPICLR